MTINFNRSSTTFDSTNHRHHHNNGDADTTEGGDATADNVNNTAGDATINIGASSDLVDSTEPTSVVSGAPVVGPALSGGGNSIDYAPGGPPVPIDSQLTVTDANPVTGATVSVNPGAPGFLIGDMLNYMPSGIYSGISGSYSQNTGVLTLTGSASAAAYTAALRSITFTSTNGNATSSGTNDFRTITWTATDAAGSNSTNSAVVVGILDAVEGAFIVLDFQNNEVISVQNLIQAGFQWTVAGFGDFSGRANETDMLLEATSGPSAGAFELYDIRNNSVTTGTSLTVISPPGNFSQWTVVGVGDFSGNVTNNVAESDLLLQNTATGVIEVIDIANNVVTASVTAGAIGAPFQLVAVGDFSTKPNETDLLARVTSGPNSGTFEVFDITGNTVSGPAFTLGQVGLEWSVVGVGDFSGNPNETDVMLRATVGASAGAFEILDVSNNQLTSAPIIGTIGLEWGVAGFGDFSGNTSTVVSGSTTFTVAETDMLLRNSVTDQLQVVDIAHNKIPASPPEGAIGSEWGVAGFGDFSSNPFETDMVMRDTAVETASLTTPPGPLGSVAAAAAPFIVFGDLIPQFTGALVLTDGTFSTSLAYTGNATYTANLDTWSDGLVSATLSVVDWYGNSFTTSTAVQIDPDFGQTVAVTPSATLIGSAAASAVKYIVTGNLDASNTIGSLTLTDGVMSSAESFTGNGTYTFNLAANSWSDGTITSTLTVTDVAGNSFSAAGAPALLDKEAGISVVLTVSPVTETIGRATATFTITGIEPQDSGPGNTATVSFVEGGATLSTVISGVTIGQTYTEVLSSATSAPFFGSLTETVSSSLSFTDFAGNSFTAAGNNVTLVPPNPGLQVAPNILTPLSGTVEDLYTGSITLVVDDVTNGSQSLTVSETAANGIVNWSSSVTYGGTSWSVIAYETGVGGTAVAQGSGSPFVGGSPTNLALTDPDSGDPIAVPMGGASGFSGTVADLANIAFNGSNTLAYAPNTAGTGGNLTVSDGTNVANIGLIGQFAAAEFAMAPDPGGGTLVTYGEAPPGGGATLAMSEHPH